MKRETARQRRQQQSAAGDMHLLYTKKKVNCGSPFSHREEGDRELSHLK